MTSYCAPSAEGNAAAATSSPAVVDAASGSSDFDAAACGRRVAGAGRGGVARGGELAAGAGLTAATSCTTGAAGTGGAACTGVSCVCLLVAGMLVWNRGTAARLPASSWQGSPIVITMRVAAVPAGPGATRTHAGGADASGSADDCGTAGRSATAPRAGSGGAAVGGAGAAGDAATCVWCAVCAVAAAFFDAAPTATVLDWVTGASSPGLFTRTETTTLVGFGRVAVAVAAAAWLVPLSCALACGCPWAG